MSAVVGDRAGPGGRSRRCGSGPRAGRPGCSWPGWRCGARRPTPAWHRRRPAPARLLRPPRCCPALAPAQRDLLVRAAPLERLSGSLCDAALEVTGSAAVLAALDRADLFVVALDAEREWYRCHRLLRDALLRAPGARRAAPRRPAPGGRLVRRSTAGSTTRSATCWTPATHAEPPRSCWRPAAVVLRARLGGAPTCALGEQLPEAVVTPQLACHWPTPPTSAAGATGCPLARPVRPAHRRPRHRHPGLAQPAGRRADAARRDRHAAVRVRPAVDAVRAGRRAGGGGRRRPDTRSSRMALGSAYGLDGRFAEARRSWPTSWRRRGEHGWCHRASTCRSPACSASACWSWAAATSSTRLLREAVRSPTRPSATGARPPRPGR